MRIRKISRDKIVVQLTDTDLEYFAPDFKEHKPQAADLHEFLYEVMELVQTETGFDPYNGGQVVVEATTSPGGMCLIISKIHNKKSLTRDEFSKIKNIRVRKKTGYSDRGTQPVCKHKKRDCENTVFVFESFEDFEEAIVNLNDVDFSDNSLYRNKDRYALITRSGITEREYNLLSEYAQKTIRNDVIAYSICESWKKICENEALSQMAKNIQNMH